MHPLFITRLRSNVQSHPFDRLRTSLRLKPSSWTWDERGTTILTYVLVLPMLVLIVFGALAVWRVISIKESLYLGTYQAARVLSWEGRDMPLSEGAWRARAEGIIEAELGNNPLLDSNYALEVTITLPKDIACGPLAPPSRLVDDVIFTVRASLTLPSPVFIPYLAPFPMTLTEQRTSYVECPRGWDPYDEGHSY